MYWCIVMTGTILFIATMYFVYTLMLNTVKFSYKYVVDKHFLIWFTYFMIHICNIHELQICRNIMSQTVST